MAPHPHPVCTRSPPSTRQALDVHISSWWQRLHCFPIGRCLKSAAQEDPASTARDLGRDFADLLRAFKLVLERSLALPEQLCQGAQGEAPSSGARCANGTDGERTAGTQGRADAAPLRPTPEQWTRLQHALLALMQASQTAAEIARESASHSLAATLTKRPHPASVFAARMSLLGAFKIADYSEPPPPRSLRVPTFYLHSNRPLSRPLHHMVSLALRQPMPFAAPRHKRWALSHLEPTARTLASVLRAGIK